MKMSKGDLFNVNDFRRNNVTFKISKIFAVASEFDEGDLPFVFLTL
jgi:hypothetical protein